MSARLALFGPPGSGKGTQGSSLASRLGIPTISTGDLFRDQIGRGTPLGLEAKGYIVQGQLVPDSVTNAMVEQRLDQPDAAEGFILDGYPRNIDQVGQLDKMLDRHGWVLDALVELTLPESLIVERLLKRATLEGRADDTEPIIRQRIAVYHQQTAPMLDLYRQRGDLLEVDGVGSIETVGQRVLAALAAKAGD